MAAGNRIGWRDLHFFTSQIDTVSPLGATTESSACQSLLADCRIELYRRDGVAVPQHLVLLAVTRVLVEADARRTSSTAADGCMRHRQFRPP